MEGTKLQKRPSKVQFYKIDYRRNKNVKQTIEGAKLGIVLLKVRDASVK